MLETSQFTVSPSRLSSLSQPSPLSSLSPLSSTSPSSSPSSSSTLVPFLISSTSEVYILPSCMNLSVFYLTNFYHYLLALDAIFC